MRAPRGSSETEDENEEEWRGEREETRGRESETGSDRLTSQCVRSDEFDRCSLSAALRTIQERERERHAHGDEREEFIDGEPRRIETGSSRGRILMLTGRRRRRRRRRR